MDWDYLKGKSLLVVGGTGFFGQSLLDYISKYGEVDSARVMLVGRGKKKIELNEWNGVHPMIHYSEIDQLRFSDLPYTPDYVIHAATTTDPSESLDSGYLYKTIILGTKRILDECKRHRPKAFLYMSSGAVYGFGNLTRPAIEIDGCSPRIGSYGEEYGHFKRTAEVLCRAFYEETRIPTTVARCFAFSGKRLPFEAHFALTDFLRTTLRGEEIVIKSSGNAVRSYMSGSDLSEWLLTVLSRNSAFDLLNVGSDIPIKTQELAEMICDIVGGSYRITNEIPERNPFYVPSISRARETYGLKLRTKLIDDINDMIAHYRRERVNPGV